MNTDETITAQQYRTLAQLVDEMLSAAIRADAHLMMLMPSYDASIDDSRYPFGDADFAEVVVGIMDWRDRLVAQATQAGTQPVVTFDHSQCPPEAHLREVDARISPEEQLRDEQGLMGCNGCGESLYYCEAAGWYYHAYPWTPDCWLAGQ